MPLAVLAGLACTGVDDRGPLGPIATRAFDSAGFRWRRIDLTDRSLRLYVERRVGAAGIADSVRAARSAVLTLLSEPNEDVGAGRPALFFLASRRDMVRIAGRPVAGFVQPGEATAFFVWSRSYQPPLRHELAHLYTFSRWGRPAAGDSAAWLVEGIGAWAGGACQGHVPDALAAGLMRRGALPALSALRTGFRRLPEDVGLPAAGSVVAFLYRTAGIAGLRDRWRGGARESITDSAEAAWREYLATVEPATLDLQRVMREGC